MHFSSINLCALCCLISLTSRTTASFLNHPHTIPQLPPQVPQQSSLNPHSKSWLSLARDCLIQTIWRIPPHTDLARTNGKGLAVARPPSTLLARYGGDLVLRFDINSADEADALAQAINILFLDVWEFTSDWVDIRLSKDVVSTP